MENDSVLPPLPSWFKMDAATNWATMSYITSDLNVVVPSLKEIWSQLNKINHYWCVRPITIHLLFKSSNQPGNSVTLLKDDLKTSWLLTPFTKYFFVMKFIDCDYYFYTNNVEDLHGDFPSQNQKRQWLVQWNSWFIIKWIFWPFNS